MWPWGHAAAGYLLYSLWTNVGRERAPGALATVVLAVGTQFPDLVDKPLAWTLAVLPNGRSLGHSAITATVLTVGVWLALRERGHERLAGAFAVGYWTHLLTDGLQPLLALDLYYLTYLGYPLYPPIDYGTDHSFVGMFLGMEFTPFLALEFVLVALAFAAWWRDGRPGLGFLGRALDPRQGATVDERAD
jgi:hypothetical protein